jgi:hypothetical protein
MKFYLDDKKTKNASACINSFHDMHLGIFNCFCGDIDVHRALLTYATEGFFLLLSIASLTCQYETRQILVLKMQRDDYMIGV